MKISDRDKKLILFVLLVAVIALPIFLFIKPKNQSIKDLDAELVGLNDRYNYLKELSEKQPGYEAKIAELNQERDKMIQEFAGGIKLENTIMFLRGVELSDSPVRSMVISFMADEETPITEASVNENGEYVEPLVAIKSSANVVYKGQYDDVKEFINFIYNYEDKMNISSISLSLDHSTNEINGSFTLDQYAISGNGKDVKNANIPSMEHGTDRLFELVLDNDGNPLTPESKLGIKVDEEEIEEEVEVIENTEE
ncbi:hypothetical protein SAMN04487760_101151 [Lachnospiraceae bacterium G41]|nr:hypothetical protein SAMN04487760_101151 [Lachnospiraceae bacterium G41]